MSIDRHLLTSNDLARALNVDVRTIHRMVARGLLVPIAKAPGIRGAYLFDPSVQAVVEHLARAG